MIVNILWWQRGRRDWFKCSIPLQEEQIPGHTLCRDLLSNLGSHPPENCCPWEKVLKGHAHHPRTQGQQENFGLLFSRRHLFPNKGLSASYFRSTCIFIQLTLCVGDCLWALRFYQCLFKAGWKIAQDANRMWDTASSSRAAIWFLPLWNCHLSSNLQCVLV